MMKTLLFFLCILSVGCATTGESHLTIDVKAKLEDTTHVEGMIPSAEISAQYKF
jgi:hypothetical protein